MGLDWQTARFLAESTPTEFSLGQVATIGRLNLFTGRHQGRVMLENLRPDLDKEAIRAATHEEYCEDFLELLGAQSVDSLDFSDYEGATIVHDFNRPIPMELSGRFDLVIEGGSIEHIFDVKTSFENLMRLVRPGGHVLINQMANNFFGHGFYQFSPELFYRVFHKDNGFAVRYCAVYENYMYAPYYAVPDPALVRSRIEAASPYQGMQVIVLAEKISEKPLFVNPPLQSDYQATWEEHKQIKPTAPPVHTQFNDTPGMVGALRNLAVRRHDLFWKYSDFVQPLFGFLNQRTQRRQFSIKAQRQKFIRNSVTPKPPSINVQNK